MEEIWKKRIINSLKEQDKKGKYREARKRKERNINEKQGKRGKE